MAIERKIYLYELLIRLGHGGFEGARAIEIETFMEDGQPVGIPSELPARAIALDELSGLMGAEAARLITTADAAVAEALALKAEVEGLRKQRDVANEAARQAQAAEQAARTELAQAQAEAVALRAAVQALQPDPAAA